MSRRLAAMVSYLYVWLGSYQSWHREGIWPYSSPAEAYSKTRHTINNCTGLMHFNTQVQVRCIKEKRISHNNLWKQKCTSSIQKYCSVSKRGRPLFEETWYVSSIQNTQAAFKVHEQYLKIYKQYSKDIWPLLKIYKHSSKIYKQYSKIYEQYSKYMSSTQKYTSSIFTAKSTFFISFIAPDN